MDTNGRKKMHLTGRKPRRRQADTAAREAEAQIQYTPAKPFHRNRFLLRLATVAAVVLALVVGMSIFFKVDEDQIRISGTVKYTEWDVREASGIRDGDGLLGLNEAKISARIIKKLPYVNTVRVGIKLPDTVFIEITEQTVAYAMEDKDGAWWLINAEGRILDSVDAVAAKSYTQILHVKIQNAVIGEQAVPAEPEETGELPAITAQSQLSAALQVLTALERNGIMGNVKTLDVADLQAIELQYENRFQVNLGDTSRLDYKVASMKAAVETIGKHESGYLDASFTVHPDGVQLIRDNAISGTKK